MDVSTMMDRPRSPGCESAASNWSADRPIDFKGQVNPEVKRSESPSCVSVVSNWSEDRPIDFKGPDIQDIKRSESPSCMSAVSNWSEDRPIDFKGTDIQDVKRSESPSCVSVVSNWSEDRPIDFKGPDIQDIKRSESPSCMSAVSNWSEDRPIDFKGTDIQDIKSLVSGRLSAACSYMSMATNPPEEDPQEHRPSPDYAEAGDVACDLCKGRKLKACKSCMTCLASFCETHVRDHYTVEALQRHLLVEITKSLNILQENAQLKKIIREERSEKMALRKEITTLRQKICELRLPDYICKGKIPAAANLTLDPETAHCTLILSDDRKRVRLGERKTVNHSAQRFDKYECVLTTEGFSTGRHYWEVEVNKEFTIGVARESAQRKGKFNFSPSVGYWCLYHYRQSFTALDEPSRPLPIDAVPRVLGVCLDIDEKWVIFYNTETKAHIYTFRQMEFGDREKIYPVFTTLEKSVGLKIKTVT
ncbi:ret finger protein-like 3 isoform X1 [Pygocentrus nattereri]|uniref:ret finger protein-like 3 isoform X1 n=1 Tax=Pygocentrus nattereri TaxID=42514 RepID=UPI000814B413|nr:ret finger protein-like 3 isoform X1 [Pygocentrus nattereri]